MAIVKLKTPCKIYSKTSNDLYGQPVYSDSRNSVCGVVKLTSGSQSSTVRTDSGGTRGHADELVANAKLLLSVKDNIVLGDVIEVNSIKIRVTGLKFGYGINGKIDYVEASGTIE